MNVIFFIDQLSSGILHCHVPSQGRAVNWSEDWRLFQDVCLGHAMVCSFEDDRSFFANLHCLKHFGNVANIKAFL